MNNNYKKLPFLILLPLFFFSCQKGKEENLQSTELKALPMAHLPLDDLSRFSSTGDNWSIAGNVQADLEREMELEVFEGTGVLVNDPGTDRGGQILTELQHGDLELKLEFLVPKGSNSGLYFQERYEVQIRDSWRVEEPSFQDTGGIYERWDESRPEGEKGYGGVAPRVNATLAPGLWQEYHILFRAPRFDEQGNKVRNARFDWIDLNGVRIQENVELTGPTRGAVNQSEQPLGALMIQGDHGPVAFRNIRYKTFGQSDSLRLGEMNYTVYNYKGNRTPEQFDNLEIIAEGTTSSFNVSEISPVNEDYAIQFTGELYVPVSGDYFFQTSASNGGNLFINDELIVENSGEFEGLQPGNIVWLEEGTHQLRVTYFQIMWGAHFAIQYEGPGIEKRDLIYEGRTTRGSSAHPITVLTDRDSEYPEIIGGFFNHGGEKRTHTLSVGTPEGLNYSYDLSRGTMLSFWRAPFADVTQMWQGRGHEQLLVPMNAAIEESSGIQIAVMNRDDTFRHHQAENSKGVTEYTLDSEGRPVFTVFHDDVRITDRIAPSESGSTLIRNIHYQVVNDGSSRAARVAQGESIELLPNGLYRVNGRYYIRILNSGGSEPEIVEDGDVQALFIPILRNTDTSEIRYELIW